MDDDPGIEGQVGRHGGTDKGAAQVVLPIVGVVNGPEDGVTGWAAIDWRPVENDVLRLRQRIFAARRQGTACEPSGLA
ncbi:hypothetical protein ACFY0A_34960 [Streptomyces sp. NPDC001698]|uniref:hypothetical protein n=1 Tax=unclassified Streptomyces TaxID=2593676 RepID=UPI0036BC676F